MSKYYIDAYDNDKHDIEVGSDRVLGLYATVFEKGEDFPVAEKDRVKNVQDLEKFLTPYAALPTKTRAQLDKELREGPDRYMNVIKDFRSGEKTADLSR